MNHHYETILFLILIGYALGGLVNNGESIIAVLTIMAIIIIVGHWWGIKPIEIKARTKALLK